LVRFGHAAFNLFCSPAVRQSRVPAVPHADEETGKLAAKGMQTTGGMLLGRRTYEDLLPHWNKAGGPFKDMLNNMPKYDGLTT
jgi:hypothetical protein